MSDFLLGEYSYAIYDVFLYLSSVHFKREFCQYVSFNISLVLNRFTPRYWFPRSLEERTSGLSSQSFSF
jgi:hypothetical protein